MNKKLIPWSEIVVGFIFLVGTIGYGIYWYSVVNSMQENMQGFMSTFGDSANNITASMTQQEKISLEANTVFSFMNLSATAASNIAIMITLPTV